MKRRVYKILEVSGQGDRLSRIFDLSILILISLNILAVVLESVRVLHELWGPYFRTFEVISVAIFSFEESVPLLVGN